METSFGESFSNVQAYTGPEATAASETLGARAYAVDNRIAFGAEPSKELVAHELTHVVQQRRGNSAVQAKAVSSKNDSHEQEADAVADVVARGGSARGLVTQAADSDVSRDVFDVLNVTGTGVGTLGRMAVTQTGLTPLVDAMTESVVRSPKYILADIRELLKDHWLEIVQSMAAFIAIEVGVAALIAAPDPTMGTKVAALLLQAIVLALMVYFAVESTTAAAQAGQLWWDTLASAIQDPSSPNEAKIELAAQYFSHLVLNTISAIVATADGLGIAWRGIKMPESSASHAIQHPDADATQGSKDHGQTHDLDGRHTSEIAAANVELQGHEHAVRAKEGSNGEVNIWLCSDCAMLRAKIDEVLGTASDKGPTKSMRRRLEKLRVKVADVEGRLNTRKLGHSEAIDELNQIAAHLVEISRKFPSADSLCMFCAFEAGIDYDLLAKQLGYERTNVRSHGQAVYRQGNDFISPDVDRHRGGVWKKAKDDPANLRPSRREGTYNEDLSERVGP